MSTLDEELNEAQEADRLRQQSEEDERRQREFEQRQQQDHIEFEQQQQLDRQRQQSPADQAKQAAKQKVKDVAKKAVKKVAKQAAQKLIAATAPYWGTALAIIGGIVLVICLVLFVIVVMAAKCNEDSWTGWGARVLSKATSFVGMIPADICAKLAMNPSLSSGGASGGAGGGASFSESDAATRAYLAAAPRGIRVNKDDCAPGQTSDCTSLTGMKSSTIAAIVDVAAACDTAVRGPTEAPDNKCGVVVTGGTEPGHEAGRCSHANGYKVDLGVNSALNSFIMVPANKIATRSDGAQQWRYGSTIYAYEASQGTGPHWDIVTGCN